MKRTCIERVVTDMYSMELRQQAIGKLFECLDLKGESFLTGDFLAEVLPAI